MRDGTRAMRRRPLDEAAEREDRVEAVGDLAARGPPCANPYRPGARPTHPPYGAARTGSCHASSAGVKERAARAPVRPSQKLGRVATRCVRSTCNDLAAVARVSCVIAWT